MKKRMLIVPALSLSLISTPLVSNFAEASELPNVPQTEVNFSNQNQQFEYDGVIYTVSENNDYRTVIAENSEGTQTFVTDKSTGYISVKSNYLNKGQITKLEKQANQIKVEKNIDKSTSNTVTQSNESAQPNTIEIVPRAMVGSWAWSSWTNYTVTADGKFTTQVITQTLLSLIPGVGPYAGAFATIMIQYSMKTGYFKKRGATAADSDPNYLWRKVQINLYKDSARTNLLSSKTTSAEKVRVY